RARDILLKHRGPDTPVGLVDGAYRPGCRVWQTTLGGLTTDGVSMTTTIIIGNGTTRIINGRVVTPRKYDLRARSASKGCSEPPSLALRAGREILQQSFAIIERELGPHDFPLWAFAVVRRMIHASADFEFAQTLRYSGDFEAAIRSALRARQTILTDTEMVRIGIRSALRDVSGLGSACLLNHWETSELATSASLTRSAAGIRLAARQYRLPIVVIGNAPTALDEALRLIEEENWRPAAIIGLPVGFIGVAEAKSRLLEQSKVPYLTCIGRKGGSAVAAAAVNALVELFGRSSDG
ncbi:MAG TPA: precorrin-8X methylmutase, partial [Gemmataceae bacterium]|nr:precorrin-8X methylmutase [Gemmataceae bacterium]